MQLTHETLRGIYSWFRECYPNEGCGLIDGDGRWVPVANVAPRPATSFLMAPGVAQAHGARAILHSHPNDWRCPSRTDMEAQAASGLPWGIVWIGERTIEPPFWWDGRPRDPTGQGWRSGVHDCFNLIRWGLSLHGATVPDVPRRPMSAAECLITIRARVGQLHGLEVDDPYQAGDVLLFGRLAPHLGIIEPSGLVWHHPGPVDGDYAPQNLPVRTPLDALRRGLIQARWRHESLASRSAA